MGGGKRIDLLCSLLVPCKTFADVGCDHGYCTEYMLKNGLCERAVFSDVSKGSLQKAEKLLAPFVAEGKAKGVLGDGFYGVEKDTEQVLIAGMGGGEIVKILSDARFGFMPERFVFQPMHDSELLRTYILQNGGYIERDFTFEEGKFYDVIVGGKSDGNRRTDGYTALEYEFGRENLRLLPKAFIKRCEKQIAGIEKYLASPTLQEESKTELLERKRRLREALGR